MCAQCTVCIQLRNYLDMQRNLRSDGVLSYSGTDDVCEWWLVSTSADVFSARYCDLVIINC